MIILLGLILLLLGLIAAPVTTGPDATSGTADTHEEDASREAFEADAPFATLTIRNWVCPVEFAGADYVQACQTPVADMEFALTAPAGQVQTALTDAAGQVAFTNLPAGSYEITGGPPGEFVQNAIACRITDLEGLTVPYFPRDNRSIGVTLVETNITCDWFSIPEDLRGDA